MSNMDFVLISSISDSLAIPIETSNEVFWTMKMCCHNNAKTSLSQNQ